MKVSRVETIVIGAGFAGLSAAYHLAKSGHRDVLVIEQDKKLGGHSSGRNAGMIRQAIQDPVLARLAVEGRKSLGWETRRWKEVSYRPNGSLLLAKGRGIKELKETAATLKAIGLGHRWYSKKEACDFVSALKQGDFEEALFCPTDAFVEIQGLLQGFLKALRRYKIEVLCGYRFKRIQKKEDGFLVEAGQKKFFAKRVVNAAGAWAGLVGEKAGAAAVPLAAYRRHLYESRSFKKTAKAWPFVWDLSHHFYFRPVKQGLLLSPCDKTPCKMSSQTTDDRRHLPGRQAGTTKIAGEKIDPRMKGILLKKLKKFSKNFSTIDIDHGKAGLRTMAPDGRFVIGEDPKLKKFYWVAGLGGHGVTTSFSVGNFITNLILGRKVNRRIQKAMSPSRFLRR